MEGVGNQLRLKAWKKHICYCTTEAKVWLRVVFFRSVTKCLATVTKFHLCSNPFENYHSNFVTFRYISLHFVTPHRIPKFWLHCWTFRYQHHELLAMNFSKTPRLVSNVALNAELRWKQYVCLKSIFEGFPARKSWCFDDFSQLWWTFSAWIPWISELNLWNFVTFYEKWSPFRGLVLRRRCE